MNRSILYFYNHSSPWTYLGHERFLAVARRAGAEIVFRPCDSHAVFSVSGGLPVRKRAPQRQAYRLTELERWRSFLGIPLIVQPKSSPCPAELSNRFVVAAQQHGGIDMGALSGALLKALWAEDRNISHRDVVVGIAGSLGLDGAALMKASGSEEVTQTYDAYTREAIERQVFGAPTYIVDGEMFWGQDRLEFLERKLAA
jgi:2-hydroxychromene-2-carboxylate isomerase